MHGCLCPFHILQLTSEAHIAGLGPQPRDDATASPLLSQCETTMCVNPLCGFASLQYSPLLIVPKQVQVLNKEIQGA